MGLDGGFVIGGLVDEEVESVFEVDTGYGGVDIEEEHACFGAYLSESVLDATGNNVVGDAAEGL